MDKDSEPMQQHLDWLESEGERGSRLILRGKNLRGFDFQNNILDGADFTAAVLDLSNFNGASMKGASLSGASLKRCDLRRSNCEWADMREVDLSGAHLQFSSLNNADLSKSNLDGTHLQKASLQNALLEGASLRFSHLQDTLCQRANFLNCNLDGADLRRSRLFGAQLTGAVISDETNTSDWNIPQVVCDYFWSDSEKSVRSPTGRNFSKKEFTRMFSAYEASSAPAFFDWVDDRVVASPIQTEKSDPLLWKNLCDTIRIESRELALSISNGNSHPVLKAAAARYAAAFEVTTVNIIHADAIMQSLIQLARADDSLIDFDSIMIEKIMPAHEVLCNLDEGFNAYKNLVRQSDVVLYDEELNDELKAILSESPADTIIDSSVRELLDSETSQPDQQRAAVGQKSIAENVRRVLNEANEMLSSAQSAVNKSAAIAEKLGKIQALASRLTAFISNLL